MMTTTLRTTFRRLTFSLVAGSVLTLLGQGCAKVDNETQITVALEAETEVPAELDSFAIRVSSTRTGELRFSRDYFPNSGREFPTTLAVIPLDESSLDGPIRIDIEGRKGGATFLRRQSVVSYLRNRNMLLTLPLRMACFQFKDCGPNQTCAGGQCIGAEVDAKTLPDYDDALVFGRANSSCFDEEQCLDAKTEIVVNDDCTFDLQGLTSSSDQEQGNVSIRWAAAPKRLLALDANDEIEGWKRIDASRGQLSKGICDSHFRRRDAQGELLVPDWAEKVYFTSNCKSKTRKQPYCFSAKTQHAGIGKVDQL